MSPYPRWDIKGIVEGGKHCPRYFSDPEAWRWLDLFQHYRAGHLYVAGGIADQPALYLAVMRIISTVIPAGI